MPGIWSEDHRETPRKGQALCGVVGREKRQGLENLLRKNIDRILPTVKTFDEFLEAMRQEGYEIVQSKNF